MSQSRLRLMASSPAPQHKQHSKPGCVYKDLLSGIAALSATLVETTLGNDRGRHLYLERQLCCPRETRDTGRVGNLFLSSSYMEKNPKTH